MGRFSKYLTTLRSHNSGTPRPYGPTKLTLKLYIHSSVCKRKLNSIAHSGVTSSRAPGGKMLLSRPPPPPTIQCRMFYSIVNHHIQRVRSAVNISSILCLISAS